MQCNLLLKYNSAEHWNSRSTQIYFLQNHPVGQCLVYAQLICTKTMDAQTIETVQI